MRFVTLLAPACLILAGCVSEEQPVLSAAVSQIDPQVQASAVAQVAIDPQPAVLTPASAANASAAIAEQPVLALAATFVPPAIAPLPVERPDFGDRPVAAAAPAAAPNPIASLFAMTSQPARQEPVAAADGALSYAPSFAAGRTLVGYEEVIAEDPDIDSHPMDPQPAADGQRWRAAWDYVKTDCFPQELKAAMNIIARHFNSDVLVASGFRGNGRSHSMHRSCRAADIRVAGVAPSRLAAFAKTVPGINGVGTYRRNSLTHIDVRAEKYAWRY